MDIFMKYPEYFIVGFLGIFGIIASTEPGSIHCPGWLAQPAKTILLVAPRRYCAWVTKMLTMANWRTNLALGDLAGAKLYPALLCMTFSFFLPVSVVLIAVFIIWFLPDVLLLAVVKHRQHLIRTSIPQALDLLILCIDAGLGLDAALQRISRDDGVLTVALNEEISILSREIFLGRARDSSYQDLFARTGVDELKTLGSALTQSSKLGLSVSTILRAQSDLIRKRQAQRAEESALRMPIYMAFPLWFLIMPSLMLLVLGPSLIRFYQTLHAGAH